jgi:hypothetical protein
VRSGRAILVAAWLVMMLYAFPGYMSADSVAQLLQARSGEFTNAHPPIMSALWAVIDAVVPGPAGMLVLQTTCFLLGAYLLYLRVMVPRTAAICAAATLLFPPIAAVMGVIWKDSQMVAYLTLGTALLLSPRRNVRLGGLALLFVATALRYNAPAITFPIVTLLFVWRESMHRIARYAIAFAAWLGITAGAMVVNGALVSEDAQHVYLWHDAIALVDMTGTLRHAPDLTDDELRSTLDGAPLAVRHNIQAAARADHAAEDLATNTLRAFGPPGYTSRLWITTYHLFRGTANDAERAAVARAWRDIVLGHPGAYLAYRANVFRDRVRLGGPNPANAYVQFTDGGDPTSVDKTGHDARPSWIQKRLRSAMVWVSSSALFRPYVYLVLALTFAWLCRMRRELLAVLLSGVANEAALFFLAPTTDYRYSVWLVTATTLVVIQLVALRARRDTSSV